VKSGWFARVGLCGLALVTATAGYADEIKAGQASKATTANGSGAVAAAPREMPELVTDRPDITESSAVVGRGVWQLESGVSFERDGHDADASRALSAPMALLRLGLSDRLELRLGADGFESQRAVAGGSRMTGFSDVTAGFKYVLADQAHLGFDLAVIPFVSMPTGSDAFSSGSWDPTIKLTWARDLPRGFGLSGNVNVSSITEGERYTPREVMFSLGHDLAGGWAGFWEVYGASSLERGGSAAWLVDTGVTHPLGHDVQVDFSVGRGLNRAAPDWFVGVGISMRGWFHR
jgi:hypothetical protein